VQATAGSEWRVHEQVGRWSLFVGKPGPSAGHVVEASSYFDRMWKRENLVDRYFIVLRKGRLGEEKSIP